LPGLNQIGDRADDGAALNDQHRTIYLLANDILVSVNILTAGEFEVGAGIHRLDRAARRGPRSAKAQPRATAQAESYDAHQHHKVSDANVHCSDAPRFCSGSIGFERRGARPGGSVLASDHGFAKAGIHSGF
jgi:hypothetical protein